MGETQASVPSKTYRLILSYEGDERRTCCHSARVLLAKIEVNFAFISGQVDVSFWRGMSESLSPKPLMSRS